MKLDTLLISEPRDARAQALRLADTGVDGIFTFEGPRDVFLPLALAADATDLDVYTNVAIAFPRSPLVLAHQAWDLQQLSGGGFMLGLGAQVRSNVERRYGAAFDRPVGRMREWIEAIHAIFDSWQTGEPPSYEGEFTRHTLMQPTFNPGPSEFGPPPVVLGALGPMMTRAACATADGVLLHPFTTARHLGEHALPAVDEGLTLAGRARDGFTVIGEVIVCCGRDDAELAVADEGTRWLLSFYASTPSYRPPLETHGWEGLQTELNRMAKDGRWAEMPALVDDEMLGTLSARGTPHEVATAVSERFAGRVDRVAFYLPYATEADLIAEIVGELRVALD